MPEQMQNHTLDDLDPLQAHTQTPQRSRSDQQGKAKQAEQTNDSPATPATQISATTSLSPDHKTPLGARSARHAFKHTPSPALALATEVTGQVTTCHFTSQTCLVLCSVGSVERCSPAAALHAQSPQWGQHTYSCVQCRVPTRTYSHTAQHSTPMAHRPHDICTLKVCNGSPS
jgi:hypothetical protein